MPVGAAAARVYIWSSCRKQEVASLNRDAVRVVGTERHIEVVGKWGVEKWFRIREALYRELLALRTDSPFVFAADNDRLREVHVDRTGMLKKGAGDFDPELFGPVKEWSQKKVEGNAYVHVLRKTTLQHARRGEDINRQVAADARVSGAIFMANYAKETDEEMRQRSNRTSFRIVTSLPPEVATR